MMNDDGYPEWYDGPVMRLIEKDIENSVNQYIQMLHKVLVFTAMAAGILIGITITIALL